VRLEALQRKRLVSGREAAAVEAIQSQEQQAVEKKAEANATRSVDAEAIQSVSGKGRASGSLESDAVAERGIVCGREERKAEAI
jgi:hypothetical protein